MPYLGNRPDNVVIRNAQQEFNYTATSSQTTFTGADSNNTILAYNVGNVEVFFNGARLEEADFTATNGTSIVLASAAATNDLISVVATDVFESTDTVSKANGGTFSSNVTVSGLLTADNISTGGYIRGPSSLTIDPATHGDNTGTVVIAGDLTVNGTTTQVNSNEVNIGDNILKLNSDEAGTPSQNAGIEVERGTGTNVVLRWNETTDKWQFTNDGSSYEDIGAGISVQEEGSALSTAATTLNFVGSNVTATGSGATKTITIGGGDVVADTTPQLGGDLDANTKNITNVANIEIDNLKLDGNTISSTDSNGNINLSPNGTGKVYITNDSTVSTLIVESTIDGTQTAPDIDLYKNSSTPATYDYLGNLLFHGNNSNGDKHLFAQVLAMNYGNTAGAERGAMQFWSLIDGVNYNRLWWAHGGLVINESGINSYTRIEGLNDQNLVYADAANDRVGFGTNTPDYKLDVSHGTTAEYVGTFQNTADNLELKIGTTTGGYLNIQGVRVNNDTSYNIALQGDGGNVGIGILTPGTSLHIKDAITNPNTISSNIDIPASSNSMMAGPITLNATVTIPSGSSWTIV